MENSHIEWTDHTFNPWWGCQKVSEGCKNCYAETLDNRWQGGHWGPNSPRKMMSAAYWGKPLNWDNAAAKAGKKAKVFCASMADVFEDHPDVVLSRDRLFRLIGQTPDLIWQLLTKRPENIMELVPESWQSKFPDNVWMGTTVENQEAADKRIRELCLVPAKVRFLSCEPLLGPLDIYRQLAYGEWDLNVDLNNTQKINWVICGGESGHHARPMHPDWAYSLRDQCKAAGVPFFFKQWGEYIVPEDGAQACRVCGCTWNNACDGGCYWAEEDLCSSCIGSEALPGERAVKYRRVGKKAAGAELYGMEYKEFPGI